LRETTAASLLFLSLWKRKYPLYDPFCGSGTLALEAALYAWNLAPGLGRDFAFSRFATSDAKTEERIRAELTSAVDFSHEVRIYGSDNDEKAVRLAESNLKRAVSLAGPEKEKEVGAYKAFFPHFFPCEMKKARPPVDGEGIIITNPPYGKRLGNPEEAEALYREMSCLNTAFSGWKIGVISTDSDFESFYGRRADEKKNITNGALPSIFYIYEGSHARFN
jgi:putative N6-adenine-specific DNA methylase